jgi:hypothetical protein
MRPTALAAFFPWVGSFEGLYLDDGTVFDWMGLDVEGRVATTLGCDIDSPENAALLVWRHSPAPDGPLASRDEVYHEWARVKAMQAHKDAGGASEVFRDSAHLHVDLPSLYGYLGKLVAAQEVILRRTIPNWDDRPGVVQMARARTSYAMGAGKPWPHLDAAIVRGDWPMAAQECMPSDLLAQSKKYRQSYDAVRQLYLVAGDYPGDDLPDPLPNGLEANA